MKNLKTFFNLSKQLDIGSIICIAKGRDSLGNDQFDNNSNILLSTKDSVYLFSCLKQQLTLLCNVIERIGENVDDVQIKSVIYEDISDCLIICLTDGHIISLKFDCNDIGGYNDLAIIPGSIDVVEWSPDRENVVICSSETLYVLSATCYEIVNEICLCDCSTVYNNLVNVGWGKKETQFHGSKGKKAAKESNVVIDCNIINDDHGTHISWRGDGQMFSVSYWNASISQRFIYMFDKDGNELTVNEEILGLTGAISWRSCDDILTFSERTLDQYVIGFLEKNGLKHGEFKVPAEFKVEMVSWNSDSSILGLVCMNEVTNNECILLWTTCNYHWYLKQKIVLPSPLSYLLWDDIRGNRLYFACDDGTLSIAEWVTTVDSNKEWSPSTDSGYVGVIDNDEVLLTSFKEAIIPPPMSRWSLKCTEAVNRILFPSWCKGRFEGESSGVVCTITHNNNFIIWKRDGQSFDISETILLPQPNDKLPYSINHWLWISPESFIELEMVSGFQSFLKLFEVVNGSLVERSSKELPFCPISLDYFNNECVIQSTLGSLLKVNVSTSCLSTFLELPEPCCLTEFSSAGFFSLSEKNRLYKDGLQIASQVTSFLLRGSFLLVTSSLHNLILFKNSIDKCREISTRKIENGSKLVVATGTTVIFQLPRGNLETIQPRALTIESAGRMIDNKQFKEAVALFYCQRIDLNLAVDHNPQQFLENVAEFVEQVSPKWLTLLITELKPESVTHGLYTDFYEKDHPIFDCSTKVEQVCRSLYNVMIRNQETLILPILGSLVKMGCMPEALNLASTDDSLQHLLFLVDIDRLYHEALLAHNLEAALRIAGKSQKDPKEYLPYLNSLRAMEPNYMKYSIDKSLNRPQSALEHIAKCQGEDNFCECIQLVKDNCLYSTALKLFQNNPEKYKIIAELYGDYLITLKKYAEAGLMYKRSGTPRKAVDPFLKLGDWRECISLSNQCGYSDKEKETLIHTLKGVLKGMQKYFDAASLCLEVMNDVHMSIEMLALGKHWKEAIYITKSKGQEALKETVIKKHLLEHAETLKEDIDNHTEQITKYCSRLVIVRENKHKTEVFPVAEPWDIQSDACSVSSVRTGSSSISRSSKNTRKASRKMWSLKEGNPREEQALVSTMSSLFETVEKMSIEIQTTCLSLIELNFDDVAFNLQAKFKILLELCSKSKSIIWPKDPNVDEITLMDERLKIPPTASTLPDWELHILKQ